jgi:hypothetical protein
VIVIHTSHGSWPEMNYGSVEDVEARQKRKWKWTVLKTKTYVYSTGILFINWYLMLQPTIWLLQKMCINDSNWFILQLGSQWARS